MKGLDSKVWTTRDGRRLTAAEMTDEHLVNLMRYLQKPAFLEGIRISIVLPYLDDPGPTGEYAQLAYEQEIDHLIDVAAGSDDYTIFRRYVRPTVLWRSLVSEADKRGLPHKLLFRRPGKCRVCGCTDYRACLGGCFWVEPDLCSNCVAAARTADLIDKEGPE